MPRLASMDAGAREKLPGCASSLGDPHPKAREGQEHLSDPIGSHYKSHLQREVAGCETSLLHLLGELSAYPRHCVNIKCIIYECIHRDLISCSDYYSWPSTQLWVRGT